MVVQTATAQPTIASLVVKGLQNRTELVQITTYLL